MRSSRIVALLVAALACAAPSVALAQAPAPGSEKQAEAEALASKAFEAYSKADYATALTFYQQALRLAPAAAIYFNIANIYDKKLPDPPTAIDFYRKVIGASDATPDLTLKAAARIQALQQEKAPAAAPKPAEAPPADDDAGKGMKVAGGVTLGLGAVGLGLGIGFGLAAKGKLDSAKTVCDTAGGGTVCKTQQGIDDMKSASSAATVSTATFIAGGVLAATGIVLLIVAPKSAAKAATTGFSITPVVGPSQAGLGLSGVFF